jgi:glucose dehydrogenase
MSLNLWKALLCSVLVLLVPALCRAEGDVDQARLNAANSEPQNWLTLGRDGSQSYFSPLTVMNDGSVDRLGFAWTYAHSSPHFLK